MRACGGGGGAEGWHTGRGLLGGAQPPAMATASASASDPALEAERAHLERVLGATTTVLFAASLSYIALSALYACLCTGTAGLQEPDGDGDDESAAVEETKRALQEIPVVVVQVEVVRHDHGGGGGAKEAAPAGECAVCLAEYAGGEEVRELPACRHAFHRECVDRWLLTRAPTCPVCRAPVAAARRDGPGDGKASAVAGDGTPVAASV